MTRSSRPPKRRNEASSLVHPEIVSVNPFDQEEVSLLEDVPKKNYKLQEQVGKGGYGKIFAARSIMDKKVVAVKRLPHMGPRNIRKNFQEIRFLRYCMNHPNVLNFVRASLYSEEIWLITELIDGLSVMELVMAHEFGEAEIVYIIKGTLRGLAFLHENKIAHRDLKSGNIMLSRTGDVKIIDFGLSSDISQGEVTHMVGSPFWMPPEMILHKTHGLPADIWSLGITAVELANGYPPHRKTPIKAMFTAATVGYPTPFKLGNKWSPLFLDFTTRCLRKDPSKRWDASQLLKHVFLGKGKRAVQDHMSSLVAYVLDLSTQY